MEEILYPTSSLSRRDFLKWAAGATQSMVMFPLAHSVVNRADRSDQEAETGEERKTRELIKLFNGRFEGKMMIDQNLDHYQNVRDTLKPALPTFEQMAYFYALFEAIDTSTNVFQITKTDGPSHIIFTDPNVEYAGTCICDHRYPETLLITLDPVYLDIIVTHEFLHEVDYDNLLLPPEKTSSVKKLAAQWNVVDEYSRKLYQYPLLIFYNNRELRPYATGASAWLFGDPLFVFSQLFVEFYDKDKPAHLYRENTYNPQHAQFDHAYAGTDEVELIGELGSFIALHGKEGVAASLGPGLTKGASEILRLIRTNALFSPNIVQDYGKEQAALVMRRVPAFAQIQEPCVVNTGIWMMSKFRKPNHWQHRTDFYRTCESQNFGRPWLPRIPSSGHSLDILRYHLPRTYWPMPQSRQNCSW
ncbi:hypothetical protein HYV22_03955 [Candidatus Gottesmanbacteria bacterium]|nr:hypothetical protein [Candidatus Gottesmanbacteria bacterium]